MYVSQNVVFYRLFSYQHSGAKVGGLEDNLSPEFLGQKLPFLSKTQEDRVSIGKLVEASKEERSEQCLVPKGEPNKIYLPPPTTPPLITFDSLLKEACQNPRQMSIREKLANESESTCTQGRICKTLLCSLVLYRCM